MKDTNYRILAMMLMMVMSATSSTPSPFTSACANEILRLQKELELE